MIYPIFIFKTESGEFDGYFPDVEGCFFSGETFEAAMKDSESAFAQHCGVLVERGEFVPAAADPSSYLGDHRLHEDDGFLAFVNIDPTKYESKAEKFNLTMPRNLISAIDRYIDKSGVYKNRSAFLAELARKEISR
ncbi:HicB family protein [Tatumella sp. TA1]|uniref:type II toxin-antitoxin system HicB family antitoxin n=1 Tax=Rosenbergiella collisarenosi TaxID=1544695 RepID=UPI0008F7F842|nr:type II toxin-antitoxin system HicB family antitoxin [Rosenbergiella collisarenosi]MBT0721405.1 HicB family protein [Rosenbergiella collisarenosi]QGX92606.1 HicB family protein [Tatumella sp. TA1]